MKKGDRVSFQGRAGTIEGFMPQGMVDVRFDDASHRVERRSKTALSPAARQNPLRPRRKARRNAGRKETDWTRIKDPKLRSQKREEAVQGVRQRHLRYLLAQREPGQSLSPLSTAEQIELELLMQKVQPPEDVAPNDLSRADFWFQHLKGRMEEKAHEDETDRARNFPGFTAEHGWRPGEGEDRKLLDELRSARASWVRSRVKDKSDEEVMALVESTEPLLPGEVSIVLASRKKRSVKAATPRAPRTEEERLRIEQEEQKREKAERKAERARRGVERKDRLSAYNRAMAYQPKSQGQLDQNVQDTIKGPGAAVFTRPDPPRLSDDRRVYCGNPIDGTAYYLVVDNNRSWAPKWIKWAEVEAAAAAAGHRWKRNIIVRWDTPNATTRAAAVNRVLMKKLRDLLQDPRKADVAAEIQRIGVQEEKVQEELAALEGLVPFAHTAEEKADGLRQIRAAEAALQGLGREREIRERHLGGLLDLYRGLAQFRFKPAGSNRFDVVTDSDARVPRGASVEVLLPSPDKIQVLDAFFSEYQDRLENRPGVSVFGQSVGFRKYIKGRGGKRGGKPLATSLKSAEEILPGGKPKKPVAAGSEPEMAVDFARVDPISGKLTFYRVSQWQSVDRDKLRSFEPFGFRKYRASINEPLLDALVRASKEAGDLAPRGLSRDTALWLIRSGAVSVAGAPQRVMMDPHYDVLPGSTISIWLKAKADSPFFSWVPTVVPFRARTPGKMRMGQEGEDSPWAACLSEDDLQVQRGLRQAQQVLGRLRGSLDSVRSLFRRLAENPGALKPERPDPRDREEKDLRYYSDVRRAVVKLANAYTTTVRWYNDLYYKASGQDPVARRVLEAVNASATNLSDPRAPFAKALLSFRGGGGKRGLVTATGFESDILDIMDYREFIDELRDTTLARPTATTGPVATPFGIGVLRLPSAPGASGIRFLEGDVTVHPMDDLFFYARGSLDPESENEMSRKRTVGNIAALRADRPPSKADRAGQDAQDFGWLAKTYATGGLLRDGRRVDPLSPSDDFHLEPVPGWPVPFGQQLDANWAVGLVLDDVFPALRWGESWPLPDAAKETKELLLLARLYDMLGGVDLTGPLNPNAHNYTLREGHLLQKGIRDISAAEAKTLGGTYGLSKNDNHTTYLTYNPVLFELTRLFWPGRRYDESAKKWVTENDTRFGSILQHPDFVSDIDLLGRYGAALTETQHAAVTSTSPAQVSQRLFEKVSAVPQAPGMVLRGPERKGRKSPDDPTLSQQLAPYTVFSLLWPLGVDFEEARGDIQAWFSDPISYLRAMKGSINGVLSKLVHTRELGLPSLPSPLQSGRGARFIRDVATGKRMVDPSTPEPRGTRGETERAARRKLRRALARTLPQRRRGDLFPDLTEADLEKLGIPGRSYSRDREFQTSQYFAVGETIEMGDSSYEVIEAASGPRKEHRGKVRRKSRKNPYYVEVDEAGNPLRETIHTGPVEQRRKAETEALIAFHADPGRVRRRGASVDFSTQQLERPDAWATSPPGATFDPSTKSREFPRGRQTSAAYDADTVRLLEERMRSPRRPPGVMPFLFSEREFSKRGEKQALRWRGKKDIYGESALALAEEERKSLGEMISEITEAINVLDRKMKPRKK